MTTSPVLQTAAVTPTPIAEVIAKAFAFLDYYSLTKDRQGIPDDDIHSAKSVIERRDEIRTALSAAAEQMGVVHAAAMAAIQDIGEWQQLAKHQREKSANPDFDPMCASLAGIEASERRKLALGKAIFAALPPTT